MTGDRGDAANAAELAKRHAIDEVYARLAEIRRHASPRPSISPSPEPAAVDLPDRHER